MSDQAKNREDYFHGYEVMIRNGVVEIDPRGNLTFAQAWQRAMEMAGWKKSQ